MDCRNARKTSYLSGYPAIVSQDVIGAKRHIKACPECQEFIQEEESFVAFLRRSLKKETVPEKLKKNVLNIAQNKKKCRIMSYRMLAVAASVFILSIPVYIYSIHARSDSIIDKIVNDHVKFLPVPQTHVNSSNPEEVTEWFRGKVNFSVLPPVIAAEMKGGRLCLLDKKHFALLFYEYSGSPVSVFITDGNIPGDLKRNKEVMLRNHSAYVLYRRGYTILLWEDRELMYSLISEMNVEQIKNTLLHGG